MSQQVLDGLIGYDNPIGLWWVYMDIPQDNHTILGWLHTSQAIMKPKRDAKYQMKTQVFEIHSNLVQLTFASVPFI